MALNKAQGIGTDVSPMNSYMNSLQDRVVDRFNYSSTCQTLIIRHGTVRINFQKGIVIRQLLFLAITINKLKTRTRI